MIFQTGNWCLNQVGEEVREEYFWLRCQFLIVKGETPSAGKGDPKGAKAWVGEVLTSIGGKGGGSDKAAQGKADKGVTDIESVVAKAKAFVN